MTWVKNRRGIFPHFFSMFGVRQHDVGRCRWPAGALRRPGYRVLRLLGLFVALALLSAGATHGPASSDDGQMLTQSVAAAWPSDHPCGPADGSGQHHALCGALAACPICASVEVMADAGYDRRTTRVVRTDLACSAGDPLSPFHPPKLLVIA